MVEKHLYLLGLMSYSSVYCHVKYYGTLRGAKMACKRFFGPESDNCKYSILEYDDHPEFFAIKYEYGRRESD